jgi:Zn-dependent M28 family amino/carboxypeptidase
LSEENHPRSATLENKKKTVNFLTRSLSAAGLNVSHDEFAIKVVLCGDDFPASGLRDTDVVIELNRGSIPIINVHALKKGKTDKRIIVAAHYDHIPEAPGADDNASGVAALIELAFMLKETPALNCDVELVSYDAEEDGLLGSRYHAKKIKNQTMDVACMIAMDMVGYYSDKENSQTYPVGGMSLLYGTKGDFVAMVGRAEDTRLIAEAQKAWQKGTPLKILSLPAPKGLDLLLSRSDHAPFWWEGYPALFLTDTADFRNKNYHQPTDGWDTLDYDRLAQVPVGLYQIVLAIDAAQ